MYYSENVVTLIRKTRPLLLIKKKVWNNRYALGYSHIILTGDINNKLESISKKESLKLLRSDLEKISKKLNTVLKVDLTQNQFDALISLVYDIGFKTFLASGLIEMLNRQEFLKVGLLFTRYSRYKKKVVYILDKARKEDVKLYNKVNINE